MSLFEAAVLGLAQGLSEFLPISSSGHLALLEYFFGIDEDRVLSFAAMLHLGTLVSIFLVYHRDISELLRELAAVVRDIFSGRGLRVGANETRRLGFMIIAATIPTAAAGLLLKETVDGLYSSITAVGAGLIVTGALLFVSERLAQGGRRVCGMKFRHAVFIGLMQSVALCPGISRSGATIVGGLFSGLERGFAVRFAFLISIPSVLGAVVLEAPDAFREGMGADMLAPVLLGVAIAAVSGFFAIKAMIKVVSGRKLYRFSIYTWALGAAAIAYSLLRAY
ncbi:MAG: undecaprenyl-diphosphate phosphatase [Clostridiales Family XIII bacterium]|jgi:undecaprenyl-diphosphatase|nr:undecaprenyl-diphosphate phosphatase [Clostridiales Family XIII bacterium]